MSNHATTGPVTATTAPSRFETIYLQTLGPADAATGRFFTALKALPSTATGADAQNLATKAANAIEAADRALKRVAWPGKVADEVTTLVRVDSRLVADLRNVGTQSRVTSGSWKTKFQGDVATVAQQVSVVVAALRARTRPT